MPDDGEDRSVGVHEVELKLIHAWREWRPDCSCGWVGSYWKIRDAARSEGKRHVEGDSHEEEAQG